MKLALFPAAPAALLIAAAAHAQASAPQPQAQAVQAPDANEIVCQKQEVTGSRLATRRVCLTRGEWAKAKLADRQELEAVQRRGDAQSK